MPFRVFSVGGQIAAVGMVGYTSTLAIYTPAGFPIPELGTNYVSRLLPPGAAFAVSLDGAAVGSGKIAAVGIVAGTTTLPPYVMRYNPDGTPDTTFAPDGYAYLPVPASSSPQFALQPDGKYVIAVRKTDDTLSLLRIWGDAPAPQPATVAFSSSVKSKLKVSKSRRFAGTTGGTGVSKVELAIQKVDSKLLKKSKKCTYVKSKSASTEELQGRLRQVRARGLAEGVGYRQVVAEAQQATEARQVRAQRSRDRRAGPQRRGHEVGHVDQVAAPAPGAFTLCAQWKPPSKLVTATRTARPTSRARTAATRSAPTA